MKQDNSVHHNIKQNKYGPQKNKTTEKISHLREDDR